MFSHNSDHPSWQDTKVLCNNPHTHSMQQIIFFQFSTADLSFLYLHQSWLLQAMFVHNYQHSRMPERNHQNESRISRSRSVVHVLMKHLKSVHKIISTTCWIQYPMSVHQAGGIMDPSQASSAVSPSSSPGMPTRKVQNRTCTQRLPEPSQYHHDTQQGRILQNSDLSNDMKLNFLTWK